MLFAIGIGIGMWVGMFFIYVDSYLRLAEEFARVSLWGVISGALSVPAWYFLSLSLGKRSAWMLGMTTLLIVFLGTGLLMPDKSGFIDLLFLNTLMAFSTASMGVIAGPTLCDAIDYGRIKDGVERTGLYFSIFALLSKVQGAVGGALGMGIAGWFGFDLLASEQSTNELMGLHIGNSWLPATFIVMALFFVMIMPLNERRMMIVA